MSRKMTKWGFYEPKSGILPFGDDNGFNEWYFTEQNEFGDVLTMVLIYKRRNRCYLWSTNIYGDLNIGDSGSTTTLRRAMIQATNAYRRLTKDRVRIRVIT